MEQARKRLRVCLICVVLAAIILGMFYYYYETKVTGTVSEGTLITEIRTGMGWLWD